MKRLDNIPDSNAGLMDFAGTRVQIPTADGGYISILHAITTAEDLNHVIVGSASRDKRIRKPLETLKKMRKLSAHQPPMKVDGNLAKLVDLLLSFGGTSVCLPKDGVEEDLDNILLFGQLWFGKNIRKMEGEQCRCHRNSSLLWDANRSNTRICTGYALSEDGIWRQHSWVIHLKSASNQIVETTVKRVAYFGFCMNQAQCEEFLYNNV